MSTDLDTCHKVWVGNSILGHGIVKPLLQETASNLRTGCEARYSGCAQHWLRTTGQNLLREIYRRNLILLSGDLPLQLKDFARRLPDEVWDLFEPILPPRIWCGNSHKPKTNRVCFHTLMYMLITGIPWERLSVGFPSYKTVQQRLKHWLALDPFHQTW